MYQHFYFYSKLSCKSDFSLCDKLTGCKWYILTINLLSTVKNFQVVYVEVKLESLLPIRMFYFNLKIILLHHRVLKLLYKIIHNTLGEKSRNCEF